MAGAGKKTWTAGDVLTASDVNLYLMEQSLMVFASDAARDTAIPTPSEGMVTYQTDSNERLTFYDGTAWQRWDIQPQTYTPTLDAFTTDPDLGTGGFLNGYYWQRGDLHTLHLESTIGPGGAAGSGTLKVAMPTSFPDILRYNYEGSGRLIDDSASPTADGVFPITPVRNDADHMNFYLWDHVIATPAPILWTATAPFTYGTGVNDSFACRITVRDTT